MLTLMRKILKKQEEVINNCIKMSLYIITIFFWIIMIVGILNYITFGTFIVKDNTPDISEIKPLPRWEMHPKNNQ